MWCHTEGWQKARKWLQKFKWNGMICKVVAVAMWKHTVYGKNVYFMVVLRCVKSLRESSLFFLCLIKEWLDRVKFQGLKVKAILLYYVVYCIYEHRLVVAFNPVHVKGLILWRVLKYKFKSETQKVRQTGATVYVRMFKHCY